MFYQKGCLHTPAVTWWACSVENQKQYFAQNYEELFLLGFAGALEDRYQIAGLYYEYFFFYEDFIEKMPPEAAMKYLAHTIGILQETQEPDPAVPLEVVLKDVISMVLSIGDETSRSQAREVFKASAEFCAAAGNHKARRDSLATFERFKEYRFVDGGVWIALTMISWAHGIDLPAHLKDDPDMQWLGKASGLHAALLNDLYSFKVEFLRPQSEQSTPSEWCYNSVPVIMREQGVDAQAALDLLKVELFEYEESFVKTADRLRKRYGDKREELDMVEKLAKAYEFLMSGNWIWSTYCGRYQTSRVVNGYQV